MEELDGKYRVTLNQLDALTRKDQERQQEKRDLEKRLALLQHDLKEAQRKVSQSTSCVLFEECQYKITVKLYYMVLTQFEIFMEKI